MKIKDLSIDNRPREKLIKNGVESLSNEELLAILLRNGDKENSAIDLAYKILNKASNVKELFNMNYYDLTNIKGIGEAKACLIISAFELARRGLSYTKSDKVFDKAKDVFDLLNPLFGNSNSECLYVLYLDNKCHLIKYQLEASGSTNKCMFPIQKILYNTIKFQSSNIIISHNHPSGDLYPSKNDILSTETLKDSLELIGINLLDHIIIGNNSYYSFNEMHII